MCNYSVGDGSSESWSGRVTISSKNSTLGVEFAGEGGKEISSMNSTLDVEFKGKGESERSAGEY